MTMPEEFSRVGMNQMLDILAEAALNYQRAGYCPCGASLRATPMFHRRQQLHDCIHHPRTSCGVCRAVDRMLAAVEARLYVEATSGPFIITRWEVA